LEVDAQSAGDKVRVSLVATPTSADLPTHHRQFEAADGDRLSLLSDVVTHSIEILGVLLDERHIQCMREWGTRSAQAYRDAQDGMALQRGQSFASLARAESLYKRAIDTDPGFAFAYSQLAAVYHDLGMMAKDTATREQARQQIQSLLGQAFGS
jgi:hypothetical protein